MSTKKVKVMKIKELKNVEANYFKLTDDDNHSLYVYKMNDYYEFPINEGFEDDPLWINECISFCKKNNLKGFIY